MTRTAKTFADNTDWPSIEARAEGPSNIGPSLKALSLAAFGLALLSGCSTMVSYSPKASDQEQAIRYDHGVGTLYSRNSDHDIYIFPTYKLQNAGEPTFTISFANKSEVPVNFSVDNVKAYFGTTPIPIYSYEEKVAEIRANKRGKQVAMAILGGLAAAAAANAASRQTYTSSYSGSAWSRGHSTSFSALNTVQVYDPLRGMVVGAAIGGATGLGIRQIEYNAQNEELVANEILQQNTVDPQRIVRGNLVLKDCCDIGNGPSRPIRLEVASNGKVTIFEFIRTSGGKMVSVGSPVSLALEAERSHSEGSSNNG